MLTSGINFINFDNKKKLPIVKHKFNLIIKEKDKNQVINSLGKNYKHQYNKKKLKKFKKSLNYRVI